MAKKASDILKNIGQGIYNFLADIGYMTRPIGIVGANYEFIYRTLSRNIGNGRHEYDGYGTPIGSLADVNFNLRTIPWFLTDTNKNKYSNYFNYIRGVYDPASTLSPINGFDTVQFGQYDDKLEEWSDGVGVIKDFDIIGGLNGNIVTNSNLRNSDTSLGMMNGFILAATLDNAAHVNTIHSRLKEGISENLYSKIGLKDNNITTILNTTTNIGNNDIDSPLDSNNFGKFGTIGTYFDFYMASTETTKNFIRKSLVGADLMTAPDYRGGKQKYQASLLFPAGDYLTKVTGYLVAFDTNISGENIRYKYKLPFDNDTIYNARVLYEYLEQGNGESVTSPPTNYDPNFATKSFNDGINYGTYTGLVTTDANTLIGKTNLNFKHGKYRTLISRFHTDVDEDKNLDNEMQSAVSSQYGMSMGRNLLKKHHINSKTNGYSNPYCRVWTYHHQYSRIADMIRPFGKIDGDDNITVVKQADLDSEYNWSRFRSSSKKLNRDTNEYIDQFPSGGARLGAMGSKNEINGFVNITPTSVGNGKGKINAVKVQDCMFSIENLAWRGMRGETFDDGLSDEQKGPFGGRIMWFPPYDISFSENVSVNWSPTSFIGRGENIYTYVNTERSGQLHFKLLIDHPAILNYWKGEHNHNKGKLPDGVDDVASDEQTLLRFFAGCEILKPMKTKTLDPKPIDPKPEPKPNPVPVEKRSIDKSFSFFVFYPNNYSGIEDKPNGLVSGMEYLINGIGAQKYERKARENEVKTNKYYEDLPSTNADIKLGGKTIGGYEMRLLDGISTVKAEAVPPNRIINTVNVGGEPIDIATILNTTTKKQWYYRVDNRVSKEILRKGNYVDADSFGLNSELGYKALLEYYGSKVKSDSLYSFSSVFIALTDDFKSTISDGGLYDEEKVKELQYILNNYKIKEVNAMGVASSHGYTSSNNILNKNRAQSVVNWLKSKEIFSKQKDIDYKVKVTEIGNVGAAKSVSDKVPKIYRAAQIEIVYQVDELVNVQEIVRETFSEEGTTKAPNYVQDNYLSGVTTPSLSLMPPSHKPYFKAFDADYSKASLTRQIKPLDLFQDGGIEDMTAVKGVLPPGVGVVQEEIQQVNHRYDNESEFFSLLGTKDPFLHNKIVDKIKYFDPAFHSITPEGFNSRLTFLHQCTRQGSTVGASSVDKSGRNANNLAFGRPPICVLRVGDFYYTKIIIDSMSINYDPLVWDLNTEGIGVQPMIADIDISFKFIGGSDLAGPIARLQNALSFNYYSNTGVYDNRSEMVRYDKDDENGEKIKDFKAYK